MLLAIRNHPCSSLPAALHGWLQHQALTSGNASVGWVCTVVLQQACSTKDFTCCAGFRILLEQACMSAIQVNTSSALADAC